MPPSRHQVPGRTRATLEFVKAHRRGYGGQATCRILDVMPGGHHERLKQLQSNQYDRGRATRAHHPRIVRRRPRDLWCARVGHDLREAGEPCSMHRVARLMREAHFRPVYGYRMRRWATGKPAVLIPQLLQRQFPASRPDVAWVTDITYVRT